MDGHRVAGVILSLILLALGIACAVMSHKVEHMAGRATEHFKAYTGIDAHHVIKKAGCHRASRFAWTASLLFLIPALTGLVSAISRRKCVYVIHIILQYVSVVISGLMNGAGFMALISVYMYSKLVSRQQSGFDVFAPNCGRHSRFLMDDIIEERVEGKHMMVEEDLLVRPERLSGDPMCESLKALLHVSLVLLVLFLVSFLLSLAHIVHSGSMTGRLSRKRRYQVNEKKALGAPCVYVPRVLSPDDVINTSDKAKLMLEA